jgi:hypothetical protein
MSIPKRPTTRRDFIKQSVAAGSVMIASGEKPISATPDRKAHSAEYPVYKIKPLDVSPAKWVWYPSQRTLTNTVIFFRKEISIPRPVKMATGWLAADSRYKLMVDGKRIQWGPAPCDPRWLEADPLDLSKQLTPGTHVLGAEVLFFGHGDGTWPSGKPGFLFNLQIEYQDGSNEAIISDGSWQSALARAWKPGQYKRWYLRSFQEEFDARLYPDGWCEPGFSLPSNWIPAMELNCPADKPAVCSSYSDYAGDMGGKRETSSLRERQVPFMAESSVYVQGLVESYWLQWKRPAEEYFEMDVPDAFDAQAATVAKESAPGIWQIDLPADKTASLTFDWQEQVVGWPCFTIEAPEGTIVEILVHEAHQPGGPVLLNSHFYSWTRLICKEGINHFETFDFESLRWMQFLIRNGHGPITLKDIHVRRRVFPWPHQPQITLNDPALQRLMDASINTLHNCAQETIVDGMARERQQYSGDCGHTLHAIYFTFGETRLPARFVSTFSQGMTKDGYFLDSWPAYDRLARLSQRQMDFTKWGPILDHGIGFNFDCYYHYLYTGDLHALEEPFPRLLKFFDYLQRIILPNGLLPVEDDQLGIPYVWIDHQAYQQQRHKQCAFNLYAAAMMHHALAPLCEAFHQGERARQARQVAQGLLRATIQSFWNESLGLFIVNQPWLAEDKTMRTCDRSLATAILYDQCPRGNYKNALQTLADCPPSMGFSYPANAGWRLWALAKGGRADGIVDDLHSRWAPMNSVLLNNTLQEDWQSKPDSGNQWSHCPVAPLYILYMGIAGIIPTEPGFKACQIRPQPASLETIDLAARTIHGPILFSSKGKQRDRDMTLRVPSAIQATLLLDPREEIRLNSNGKEQNGLREYRLPGDETVKFRLRYT